MINHWMSCVNVHNLNSWLQCGTIMIIIIMIQERNKLGSICVVCLLVLFLLENPVSLFFLAIANSRQCV